LLAELYSASVQGRIASGPGAGERLKGLHILVVRYNRQQTFFIFLRRLDACALDVHINMYEIYFEYRCGNTSKGFGFDRGEGKDCIGAHGPGSSDCTGECS
jgi:hypothetical protein